MPITPTQWELEKPRLVEALAKVLQVTLPRVFEEKDASIDLETQANIRTALESCDDFMVSRYFPSNATDYDSDRNARLSGALTHALISTISDILTTVRDELHGEGKQLSFNAFGTVGSDAVLDLTRFVALARPVVEAMGKGYE